MSDKKKPVELPLGKIAEIPSDPGNGNSPELDDVIQDFSKLRATKKDTSSPQPQSSSQDAGGGLLPKLKAGTDTNSPEMPRVHIDQNLGTRRGRRTSVCGERYDPEQDSNTEVEIYEKTSEQRKTIKEHIAGIFLFNVLETADMEAVIDAMMPRPVEKGEIIIRQGDDGDYCYIIERGSYDVFIAEECVKTYDGRGCFGELALLYNMPRAATITATSDGFLWAVSRPTFRKLVVKRAHDKRQNYINLLSTVPELKPLGHYEKMVLCDALTPVSCQPGQVIFRQGDEADGMYFIVDGKVVITDDRTDERVDELSKGTYFGELGLVKKQPRAATVTASTTAKLAFLDLQAFERLLGPCMSILQSHIDAYEEIKK